MVCACCCGSNKKDSNLQKYLDVNIVRQVGNIAVAIVVVVVVVVVSPAVVVVVVVVVVVDFSSDCVCRKLKNYYAVY